MQAERLHGKIEPMDPSPPEFDLVNRKRCAGDTSKNSTQRGTRATKNFEPEVN